jgi:TrmH family RNA methyltransferase
MMWRERRRGHRAAGGRQYICYAVDVSRFNAAHRPARAVSSRSNPIVTEFRTRRKDRRPGDSTVLLDGEHLVDEAFRAGVRVRSAAFLESAQDDDTLAPLAARLARAGSRITYVTGPVMRALSPLASPGRVVALAELLSSDVDHLFGTAVPFVVAAADVQDPGNLGALIRAAEAAGASGVASCGSSADPFSWKALRGAMGSAFRLPVSAGLRVEELIAGARARRARVLATRPRNAESLYDVDLTGPLVILLGAEGSGLPAPVAALADTSITIPMAPEVESLNVAVAAAVIAFEVRRQRHVRAEGRH